MVTYEVNDMTCGHCAGAIIKAVSFIDPGAKVQVDLAAHLVQIEPTAATPEVLADAIKTAGYTPVKVEEEAVRSVNAPPRKGCCCG